MKKIHVLVIDDSALMRRMISELLSGDPEIMVADTAMSARLALDKMEKTLPDIVTLDLEMPGIDGLTALTEIKKRYPNLPVIMCSTLTRHGAQATIKALVLGADDYVAKPENCKSREEIHQHFGNELIYKIKGIVKNKTSKIAPTSATAPLSHRPASERIDIVAIGASTGGPKALVDVLSKIPGNIQTPIVIVQHMPPIFTKTLAESLSKKCAIPVVEARDGDVLVKGQAWIAPGNYHMTVVRENNQHLVRLNQDPQEHYCRPAVDVLFRSVAKEFGPNTLGVIMTGMGHDGLQGCQMIKEHSGQVITQDEATSIVWGMPGAVTKAGLADETIPVNELGLAIVRRVNRKRVPL